MNERLDVRDMDRLPVPQEERPLRRALNGEQVVSKQMICVFPDGREKVVSASSKPLMKEGKVWGEVTVWEDITELAETRQALKKENEFVSAILATSGALILVLDPDGRMMRMNRACEEVTGWRSQDVRGIFFWELIAGEEEWDSEQDTFRKITEGRLKNLEGRLLRRDGEQRWITWSATVLREPDASAIRCVFKIGIDITEIKHTQSVVEIQRHFSKQIIESCPAFFVLLTLGGDIIHMNRTALRTLGYTLEEIKGRGYSSILDSNKAEGHHTGPLEDIPRRGLTGPALHRVITKAGRELMIEWQGRETLREGKFNFLFSFGIDATERTRVMELFRKLFHGLPIGAFVAVDGVIVMANEHLESLSGYSEEEMKKYPVGHLVHHDDLERVKTHATSMLQGRENAPFEYRLNRKDGDG